MMYRCYCYACNDFFTADVESPCPHCGAVGDEIEVCDDELDEDDWTPTEEDLEAMYEDYEARRLVENRYALYGAQ